MTDFDYCHCPVCGKDFIKAPMHVYHVYGKRDRLVCSYHCMRESERRRKKKNGKRILPYD